MDKGPIRFETRVLHDRFGRFAAVTCMWLGSTWAFLGALGLVLAWIFAGPALRFAPNWVQWADTGTSVATFLMVFLVQNTQNRDAKAINLKLNELIRAIDKARDQMIDIERLTDQELDEMQEMYEKIKLAWTERHARTRREPVKEAAK